jgi:hypothetical protein
MATIVTRAGKGSPLTFQEGDANFINLNEDIEALQSQVGSGGAIDIRLDALESADVVIDSRLDAVEALNVTQDSRLTAIESVNTTQDGQIIALQAADTALDGRIDTLEISGTRYAATKAAGDTLAASLADGATVLIDEDEAATPAGVQTRRTVLGGVLSSIVSFLKTSAIAWKHGGTGAVWRTLYARLMDLPVSVADFSGFVGNGINDDTAAVLAAAQEARSSGRGLECPSGYNIKLVGDVSLKTILNINFKSNIVITGGMLSAGGNVNAGKFNLVFQDVTNGTSTLVGSPPATPVLRLTGMSNSAASVGSSNYIQLFAGDDATNERFVAYNQLKITGAVSLLELTDFGTPLSYVNENKIYADRIIRYRIIRNGYPHNHNKLYHPCMEGGDVEITMTGNLVSCNQVYGARFEGVSAAAGVVFGAGTYGNTVTSTWSGTGFAGQQFVSPIAVSDSGRGNMVTPESAFQFEKTPLFSVGPNSLVVATSTDSSADDPRIAASNGGIDNLTVRAILQPGLNAFKASPAFSYIALTEPIPVKLGDAIVWDMDYDGSNGRTVIFALDQNLKPLLSEGVGGAYVSQVNTIFDATHARYIQSANVSAATLNATPATIMRSEVGFIRVGFVLFSLTTMRHIGASLFSQAIGRGAAEGAKFRQRPLSLDGSPTLGYLPINTTVFDRTAKLTRWVSFQYETRVSGALSAGATSVTVVAISTVANGDIVGIVLDDGSTHWTSVSGLSGSSFTIAAIPVGRSVADGVRIVFNRWAS